MEEEYQEIQESRESQNNVEEFEEAEKERKVVVPGEIIASGSDILPGEGTWRDKDSVKAERFGLAEQSGKVVRVIPLSGVFIPRRGNVVIGKVNDITFNGWTADINAPSGAFLPVMEVPRYIDKNSLSEFLDVGDFFSAKISGVKQKGVDLTLDSRGLGKLEGGIIVFINPHKVPRVIGRAGSMITIIKEETNCRITVGQNGIVWIKGDNVEDEILAKKAIFFVTKNSFVSGLTDKIKEYIDSEKNNLGGKD